MCFPPVGALPFGSRLDVHNGSTYQENDVSPMNVILSVAYYALAALLVVSRGVHDLQREKGGSVTGSLGS